MSRPTRSQTLPSTQAELTLVDAHCSAATADARKALGDSTGPSLSPGDWTRIANALDAGGNAVPPQLLTGEQCTPLIDLYARQDIYRSTVVMARHGFGRGEYKYFAYPLPELLQQLRGLLYPALVPVAKRWNEMLGIDVRYPASPTSCSMRA